MPERDRNVLVVEDEATLRKNLVRYLEQQGHEVTGCETAEQALAAASDREPAVAVIDVRLPGRDGMSLATELLERSPDTGVIMMTSYSSVDSVIEALRMGAQDYLIKPVLLKDVAMKVARLVEHRRLCRENAQLRRQIADLGSASPAGAPIARSRAMTDLFAFARQVGASNATVLIEGESGAGKEVVARLLHESSARRDQPFVAVNMTAVPENLLESHLFGHMRGAFTGADTPREGLFRAAGKGTILLDEIGDMPLGQQAKLLRTLEAKELYPVGSDRPIRLECRVLASTNADLGERVASKAFRSDLFYRLSAVRLTVPPLRDRPEDIAALAQCFLERHAREHGRAVLGIDGAALRRLLAYRWPGNVRELSNVVERATIVCGGKLITVADLPPELLGAAEREGDYHDAMADFERALIGATLERADGDRRETARLLGMSLATLYRRIEKLGLKGRDEPAVPEHGGVA
jgi:two-component system, NtrC family, response regulator HydG